MSQIVFKINSFLRMLFITEAEVIICIFNYDYNFVNISANVFLFNDTVFQARFRLVPGIVKSQIYSIPSRGMKFSKNTSERNVAVTR